MKDNKNIITYERNFLIERDLFGMKIPLRSKDGTYNIAEMLSEHNKQNPKNQKRMEHFLQNKDVQTYIHNLKQLRFAEVNENMQLIDNQVCSSGYIPENQLLTDTTKNFKISVSNGNHERVIIQKQKGKTMSNGQKTKDTIFVDSLLMKKFARWLNPMYEVVVDKWNEDEIIKLRNDLADTYKEWSATLAKLGATKENDGYSEPNKLKNFIILNDYFKDCRKVYTIEQMRECISLEKEITRLVSFGFIKTLEELQNYLSRIYLTKYPNSMLPNLD
jgi:hypothetical protein